MPTRPVFISTDAEAILNNIVAFYEGISGKKLQPAHTDMLLLKTLAYRVEMMQISIQDAAVQMLVDFSRAPVIDYLGAFLNTTRLAASPASDILQLNLTPGHGGVTVVGGTRVTTPDGIVVFKTVEDVSVPAGINTATVLIEATTTGTSGNGYGPGLVNVIMDAQPYLLSVANTGTTNGGAEQETDEEYRVRIKLALSQSATAGSEASYKYHARGASAAIIDVEVNSPSPGVVEIFPLLEDGTITPPAILNAVYDACNAENVRPLTDLVIVTPPAKIPVVPNIQLVLYIGADINIVTAAVQELLDPFFLSVRQKLGFDLVDTQIKAKAKVDGVYDVIIPGFSTITAQDNEYVDGTGYTLTVTSFVNG